MIQKERKEISIPKAIGFLFEIPGKGHFMILSNILVSGHIEQIKGLLIKMTTVIILFQTRCIALSNC
jgi:hypothetical protein